MFVLAVLGLAAVGYALYSQTAGGPAGPSGRTSTSDGDLRTAYADLCRTRSLTDTDLEGARDQFYGEVHSPLHDIAREAEDANRSVAARMLEAKNDVELAFNTSAPAADTADALDRLLVRTEEALISIGVTTSGCTTS
ncbi:MAG TPA: hypothetical protein VEU28_11295 [Actinomycetota bacterium]|nr:hypothetical protein [Actinomycetota bacterium]